MGSLDSYLAVLIVLVLGALFVGGSLMASKLLAPQRPTAAKDAPYECGIVPTYELPNRYPVRFYLVAMIFIIFDIEVIFLFPWAVAYNQLGTFGLAEILVFAAAVFFSLVYLISNGGLDWGPLRRVRPLTEEEAPGPRRTTASTVRRVGSGQGSEAA